MSSTFNELSKEINNLREEIKYGVVPYSNILFKDYLNVPYNIPFNSNYFSETYQYSNYVIGEEVFLERIPEDPSWIKQDVNPYGVSYEEYYVDTTGTVEKFTKLKLEFINDTQAYHCIGTTPDGDNSINLLSDSLQFNYKSKTDDENPYDYELFIGNEIEPIPKSNNILTWLFNYKSGYVVFNCDGNTFNDEVKEEEIKFTFVRYRGKKGADKFCVQYDNSKNVGIGTETPRVKLEVSGNLIVNGRVNCKTISIYSDRRLKDNIKIIEPQEAYNIVSQLNGVRYSWKNDPESKKVGLIAQDVERILPEVVKDNYEGYKSVDYSSIVSILCQSIKQLKNELEELKTEFNKLKSQ